VRRGNRRTDGTRSSRALGFGAALFAIGFGAAPSSGVESRLIAIGSHVEHVYDPVFGRLYATTRQGLLERYDVRYRIRLAPIPIGGAPLGLDVTPDGRFAYVAQRHDAEGLGVIDVVDLQAESVRSLSFPFETGYPDAMENGMLDIAITADGRVLATALFEGGSGQQCRLREIDDGAVSFREDLPNHWADRLDCGANLWRSFDRSVIAVAAPSTFVDLADFFRYDAASDALATVVPRLDGAAYGPGAVAVAPGGAYFAAEASSVGSEVMVFGAGPEVVHRFPGLEGALFDPAGTRLFMIDPVSGELVVARVGDWAEVARFPIGEDMGYTGLRSTGEMSITEDGETVFISTDRGILAVPEPGQAVQLVIGAVLLGFAARLGGRPPALRRVARRTIAAALLGTAVFAGTAAQAATLHVASYGNGGYGGECGSLATPCRSIQDGLARAEDGDTILVWPGTYGDPSGNGYFGEDKEACDCLVLIDKRVTLRSRDGAGETLLVSGGSGHSLVRIEADGATFGTRNHGFTLSGAPPGKPALVVGSGVAGVTVAGNVARANGVGFYVAGSGHRIQDNRAEQSAGPGFQVSGTATRLQRNAASTNEIGFQLEGLGHSVVQAIATGNGRGLISVGTELLIERSAIVGNRERGVQILPGSTPELARNNHYGNAGDCDFENQSGTLVFAWASFWGDSICDGEGSQTERILEAEREIPVGFAPPR
jgi:hypothetical protein